MALVGCATREAPASRPVATATEPAGFPGAAYRQAIAAGRPVLRVDSAASSVVIEVRRAGSLARLGHDHVIAGHDVRGYLWPDARRADVFVALDALVVDEAGLRAEAGFDTAPTPEAIAGTRRNMLTRVLDAERFPFVWISVGALDRTEVASVSIALHGMTRTLSVPLHIDAKSGEWIVAGAFPLQQTDFGIVPLSLLGGAIEVSDAVEVRFRIRAVRP